MPSVCSMRPLFCRACAAAQPLLSHPATHPAPAAAAGGMPRDAQHRRRAGWPAARHCTDTGPAGAAPGGHAAAQHAPAQYAAAGHAAAGHAPSCLCPHPRVTFACPPLPACSCHATRCMPCLAMPCLASPHQSETPQAPQPPAPGLRPRLPACAGHAAHPGPPQQGIRVCNVLVERQHSGPVPAVRPAQLRAQGAPPLVVQAQPAPRRVRLVRRPPRALAPSRTVADSPPCCPPAAPAPPAAAGTAASRSG